MLYVPAHIAEAVGLKPKSTLYFIRSGNSWIFTNREINGWKKAKVYASKSKGSRKKYIIDGDGLEQIDGYCWEIKKKEKYFELVYTQPASRKEALKKMLELQKSVRDEALKRYKATGCMAYKVIAERADEAIRNIKEKLKQL